jgi:hypothetical protein
MYVVSVLSHSNSMVLFPLLLHCDYHTHTGVYPRCVPVEALRLALASTHSNALVTILGTIASVVRSP